MNSLFKKEVLKGPVFKKFLSLCKSLNESTNVTANFMYINAFNDARSIVSRNLNVIKSLWGSLNQPHFVEDNSPELFAVRELLDVKSGLLNLSLNSDDIDMIMATVCLR